MIWATPWSRPTGRLWHPRAVRQCRGSRRSGGVDITRFLVTIIFVMSDPITICRALGDITRWRIVQLVRDEALCVCELADILEMAQSSVSSHVQVLRRAGMFESERCEKWTYFRLNQPHRELIAAMETFFARKWDGHAADAAKAAERLARREGSCCPGPKQLRSRSKIPFSNLKPLKA
jgi:ArsR family transcriptional regulator